MKVGKYYRIEWKHNYQWVMELNDGLTFKTRIEAEKQLVQDPSLKNLETRIVEVSFTRKGA